MKVVVFGAGVAGWATALALRGKAGVTVLEAKPRARPMPPIAETLPGAAGRMLDALGVCADEALEGAMRRHVSRSLWSAPVVFEQDGLADPDGPGWIVERTMLSAALRSAALAAGVAHAVVDELPSRADAERFPADFLVDATGRSRLYIGKPAARAHRDVLIAYRIVGTQQDERDAGATTIEADADGWWYSSALPDGRRMLGYHTDAAAVRGSVMTRDEFLSRARRTRLVSHAMRASRFSPTSPLACASAGGAVAAHACDGRWLAVGDAALECDPIASQGLMNALFTGIECARVLGDPQGAAEYETSVQRVWKAYVRNVRDVYLAQSVYQGGFWARRGRKRLGAALHGAPA